MVINERVSLAFNVPIPFWFARSTLKFFIVWITPLKHDFHGLMAKRKKNVTRTPKPNSYVQTILPLTRDIVSHGIVGQVPFTGLLVTGEITSGNSLVSSKSPNSNSRSGSCDAQAHSSTLADCETPSELGFYGLYCSAFGGCGWPSGKYGLMWRQVRE